jgi:hypothetical protein
MVLRIHAGDKTVREYRLPANVRQRIELPPLPPTADRLRLHFSEHVHDASKRSKSFLLDDTNLFDEHDLCA